MLNFIIQNFDENKMYIEYNLIQAFQQFPFSFLRISIAWSLSPGLHL